MEDVTFEEILENDQIQSYEIIKLPDVKRKTARIMSPRLADKERFRDFEKEITEIDDDENSETHI